ncbi:P-loop containing nucleoside triphosphate hydrolase protein [Fusarium oxysporum Fo47]|nr:P-loop containing nucleoside triphosphate hydrolase protein [Fusarium oxysporum Fo47]QKD51235.2 P-loop containing nucleoside triphosphate hydrolase protein [Fusarium oxysporum Fo47]
MNHLTNQTKECADCYILTYQESPYWDFLQLQQFLSPFINMEMSSILYWLQSVGTKPAFKPSSQQLRIAKLCADQNVVVSARPGSGKTATIEAIAAAHPDKIIGSILFSKRLQSETSHRLNKYHNSDVYTFHGMAGVLLGQVVPSDGALIKLLENIDKCSKLPRWTSTPFDIIVPDEFQDCNPETFWLVECFVRANNLGKGGQPTRIVVLGDERQSIYRFRGADPRYLTLAPEVLGPISPYPFAEVQLGNSFRLSSSTVQFINRVFLGGEHLALARAISPLVKRYKPENCVIIAPSVRTRGPLQALTNALTQVYDLPIHVPPDEETPLNDKVINGKLCISTIHQFKGRERKLVILLGIDASYFEFFGRDLPDDSCPNEAFVALTRSLQQLELVHNDESKMMPCVSLDSLYDTAKILGLMLPKSCGAREITRYVQGDALDKIVERHLHVDRIAPPLPRHEHINIRNVIPSDLKRGFYESVSDINGLVIAAALELATAGTLRSLGRPSKGEVDETLSKCPEKLVAWLCRKACEYEASLSGYLPRVIQMKDHKYDWIKPEDPSLARRRIDSELVGSARKLDFEVEMQQQFYIDGQETQLCGRADIVNNSATESNDDMDNRTIWEIKFVLSLSNEHVIHACVYAYFSGSESGKLPRIILYNVRDGDKREIIPRHGIEELRQLITSVLRLRYTSKEEMTYEEFIKRCGKTTRKVMNLSDGS